MIRVKVMAPLGISRDVLDERGWIELKEGTTLKELQKKLGLSGVMSKIFKPYLNGERQPASTVLKDRDVVSYFSMIRGG